MKMIKNYSLYWFIMSVFAVFFATLASSPASAETCNNDFCAERIIKTTYGYRFLLNESQAEDWANRMESVSSTCAILELIGLKGCKLGISGHTTATQIRLASARSSSGGVEYAVAITAKIIAVGSAARPWFGGIDLDGYCRLKGYKEVVLAYQNVHGWKCRDYNGKVRSLNTNSACSTQYGKWATKSDYYDEYDPYSLYCVGKVAK